MSRFAGFTEPLELSPTRVAWKQYELEEGAAVEVSVSVEKNRLVFEVNGTSHSSFIPTEVADALLVLIAPRTSHWGGVAKQLVKLSHFSLRARAQAFLRRTWDSLRGRAKGQ